MAVGLSPCRCRSKIIMSSPSRTTDLLPPSRGAASAIAPGVPSRASSGANTRRNEVGNFQPPLLGNIQPALTTLASSHQIERPRRVIAPRPHVTPEDVLSTTTENLHQVPKVERVCLDRCRCSQQDVFRAGRDFQHKGEQ